MNLGTATHTSKSDCLLDLLKTEFDDPDQAHELLDEFLEHETYSQSFCLRLLTLAKQRVGVSWDIRRLAVLMLEHQILKLSPDQREAFDFSFAQLNLKPGGGGATDGVSSSVLKEGYSTTAICGFIPEFRRRLARLNRV